MQAALQIEAGHGVPSFCELSVDHPATLGRNRTNTVILVDEHASRWHAEISNENGQWFIRDFGTLNGTRVDGERIAQPVPLADGQTITIGNTRMRFLEQSTMAKNGKVQPSSEPAIGLGISEFQTSLCVDELTALCQFMVASTEDADPRTLIMRALHTLRAQTHASLTGFLSLDREDPLPKLVHPETAQVDVPLSRHLTQEVVRLRRAVWLGTGKNAPAESESLVSFTDAFCVPLGIGNSPLGAVHAYKTDAPFHERDIRFCEVLAGHVSNCLRLLRLRRTLEAENSRLRVHSAAGEELVGTSPAMTHLRSLIARVAPLPSTVLVNGQSGVGKELVALALHRESSRREGPLVVINCAAIAPTLMESELFGHMKGSFSGALDDKPGVFEQADEGTLFLDEIGEMSLECQAKLLRVIEGKGFRAVGARSEIHVDVRIVAATNRNLRDEADAGRFREDLYYRLSVIQISVPPLRDHAEDIPALVEHFLPRLAPRNGRRIRLSPAALTRLASYTWPGNVRQLRSVLENAIAFSSQEVLGPDDLLLPVEKSDPNTPPSLNLEKMEAWAIRQVLDRNGGNISQGARELGINRDTLRAKCRKYGITRVEEEG